MISVYMVCPILCHLLGNDFSVLMSLDFSASLCPDFSAMSIKLISAIDTSCRPTENTPNLTLYCLVKIPTESFTCTRGRCRTSSRDGGGEQGVRGRERPRYDSHLLYITHFITSINCTFYNPFMALSLPLYTLTTQRSPYSVIFGTGDANLL